MKPLALLLVLSAVSLVSANAPTFEAVQALLAEGRMPEAREALQALVLTNDAPPDAYLYLGAMLRAEGDLAEARRFFGEGVRRDGEHEALLCEYAMTLAWMDDFAQSIEVYERALAREDGSECAAKGRALVLFWNGEHEESAAAYEALLSENPMDIDALRGLADVHRSRMRTSRAEELYQRALALSPDDQRAREGLRHLEEVRRWQLSAALGGVRFERTSTTLAGRLAAAYSFSPDTSLRAAYESNVPANGASGGGGNSRALAHTASLGLSHRVSSWLVFGVEYSMRRQNPAMEHRFALRGTFLLGEKLRVLAGLRPSLDHGAHFALLGDAGVQVLVHSRFWVMAQFYGFGATTGERSWSGVGTLSFRVRPALELRLVGSAGRRLETTSAGGAISVEWQLSESWRMNLAYEIQRGEVRRHSVVLGAGVSL